jgi:hypothetical protein
MADISGYWEFHRACPHEDMTILNVDAAGALVDSSIGTQPIHGHYNAATNAISFNDQRFPGQVIRVSYYTGFVLVQAEGGAPCAMAGTYHELILTGQRPNFHIETFQSGFYALWRGPIIG